MLFRSWLAAKELFWEDEDYPLMLVEIRARQWVQQVLDAVAEGRPVPHEHFGDPHRCDFGHWYEGEGRRRYAHHAAFARIRAPHQRIHRVVERMDACWREGHIQAMRDQVPELLAARDETLARLHELQQVSARHVPRLDHPLNADGRPFDTANA